MSENRLKLAVCQLRTELALDETLRKAREMVLRAADAGADMVCLPEMFTCPYAGEYFRKFAALGHGETVSAMSAWARESGVILVGGSIPEREGERLYNTCFVFDEKGRQIARHRKVHLFDVDLPGMCFRESNTFTPGEEITLFDTRFGKMGAAVCFDVRFPELFRAMAERGARVIFLPAQFNMATGPLHWELSLRSRAMDNELFFVGASAARYEGFRYECWGHSAIVGPFGELLAQADEKEQTISAEIDLAEIDRVRAQLPTFLHLRRDVYQVAD